MDPTNSGLGLARPVHGQHREAIMQVFVAEPVDQGFTPTVHAVGGDDGRHSATGIARQQVQVAGQCGVRERNLDALHPVIGHRDPLVERLDLAMVQSDDFVSGFPDRPSTEQPQLGSGEPVHTGGDRVTPVFQTARERLVPLRVEGRHLGQVRQFLDRLFEDGDIRAGCLVAYRAERILQTILIELDAKCADSIVDQPALRPPPRGTQCPFGVLTCPHRTHLMT